ncbi:MAG: hypothetical protein QOI13_3288 [Paraburkholderia sp.]|nr:hypothetical protein [Paraburkholderia sp.]
MIQLLEVRQNFLVTFVGLAFITFAPRDPVLQGGAQSSSVFSVLPVHLPWATAPPVFKEKEQDERAARTAVSVLAVRLTVAMTARSAEFLRPDETPRPSRLG